MPRFLLLLLALTVLPVSAADETLSLSKAMSRPDDGRPGGIAEALLASKSTQVRREDGNRLYFVEFAEKPAVLAFHEFAAAAKEGAMPLAKLTTSSTVAGYRDRIEQLQEDRVGSSEPLSARPIDVVTRHSLLLNGFTAFMDGKSVELLKSVDGVVGVYPVYSRQIETDRGPTFIGSPVIWNGSDGGLATQGEGVIIGIIDTGIDPTHRSFADVGDDGYDHENPLGSGVYLGACAQAEFRDLCNDKLIGIVGYPEITSTYPPYAPEIGVDHIGHGTHVASTAAGNRLYDIPIYEPLEGEETPFRFAEISGVAPHANIVSYQVCQTERDGEGRPNNGGACLTNYTVNALEHAIEHGVAIINYSIGGYPTDPWNDMESKAFLNARVAGIHIATSAGNSGPFPETVGGPANSPWIMSVGAASHDRNFTGKELRGFSGGDTTLPPVMSGAGISPGVAGPVVMAEAVNPANALCDRSFPAGTFTQQEIVVCLRGNNPRIEKGKNVLSGGAGGMILANNNAFPDLNDIVDDPHVLPAIHLSISDSDRLRTWLYTGSGHRAEISGSVHGGGSPAADIVTFFSSRGPNYPNPELPAVHVVAPGRNIYGAYTYDAFLNGSDVGFDPPFNSLSGTSMSSPHVAGALALLHSRHPDWSPSQAQSALMMTAQPDIRMEVLDYSFNLHVVEADIHAAGSGSVRVDRAVNAGLLLHIDEQEYMDADPTEGGKLRELNFPMLFHLECVAYCTWTRTFDAETTANWQFVPQVDDSSFELTVDQPVFASNAGDEIALAITASDTLVRSGVEMNGRLWLVPDRPDLPSQQLPIHVAFIEGSAPKHVLLEAGRSAGVFDIPDVRTLGTDDMSFEVFGLATPVSHTADIPADPTPDILYDNMDEWHWVEVVATDQTRAIAVRISKWEAPDLDLFVVQDVDGDGRPDLSEFESPYSCISGSEFSDEECLLTEIKRGSYFVGIHNYTGTGAATDEHTVEIVVLDETPRDNLDVWPTGTRAPGETFSVNGYWEQDLEEGQRAYAILSMSTDVNAPEQFSETLLELRRVADDVRYAAPVSGRVEAGRTLRGELVVAANGGSSDREYSISMAVPADMEPGLIDPRLTLDGDLLSLEVTQQPGSEEQRFTIEFEVSASAAEGAREFLVQSGLREHGIELPSETSSTEVTVYRLKTAKSGGGALVFLLLLLPLVAGVRIRKLKNV